MLAGDGINLPLIVEDHLPGVPLREVIAVILAVCPLEQEFQRVLIVFTDDGQHVRRGGV